MRIAWSKWRGKRPVEANFLNLIENAIKYGGPHNEVSVTLSDISYQTRLGCEGIAIGIVDNGPGIDALDIPRLTKRFTLSTAIEAAKWAGLVWVRRLSSILSAAIEGF